jgi:2-polyprenyl-3-methyl-5-hydroxy-6-metoxy-1,4-benzoquinol methylase
MGPDLSRREPGLVEWMDRPDCDPRRLRNTYRDFPIVNRWLAGWTRLYRRYLRPVLLGCGAGHPCTLLDVGSGGGDVARHLHALARRDGIRLTVTGIDPDPRAVDFAGSPGTAGVRFRAADASELATAGERFDLVISNHVLHHLEACDLKSFLNDLHALARRRAICSDIARSQAGYLLFATVTAPFFRDSYIRSDGLISIRKSYTRDELQAAVPTGWEVRSAFPFRLLALRDVDAGD